MSPPISSDTTTSHTELPLRKGELESSLAEICEDPLVIGDLVQVSASGMLASKRLRDRIGQIGRISKVYDYKYAVDWILGGKLSDVSRDQLVRVNAEDDASPRNNRKRKQPTSFMNEVTTRKIAKKLSRPTKVPVSKGQTRKSTNDAPITSKPTKKKLSLPLQRSKSATTSRPNKSNKLRMSKITEPTMSLISLNGKENEKRPLLRKRKLADEPQQPDSINAGGLDLYERHRREFERILVRLEKIDKLGFLMGDVPPEYDESLAADEMEGRNECYQGKDDTEGSQTPLLAKNVNDDIVRIDHLLQKFKTGNTTREEPPCLEATSVEDYAVNDNSAKQGVVCKLQPMQVSLKDPCSSIREVAVPDQHITEQATTPETGKKPLPYVVPPYPPYNWKMIRWRMKLGRYVLDREKEEEDQRFMVLGPYYRTLGRKRPRRRHEKAYAPKTEAINPRVLHPKGVDWQLFRSDVERMCDAAAERDSLDESCVSRYSLRATAIKTKEALLQTCARTGTRQRSEMTAADERFKFANAIEKHKNTEAAMQSWRVGPYAERKYERLMADKVCDGLSKLDEKIAVYERRTSLPDSFVGISYRYNDTGQSEAWMQSIVAETGDNSKFQNDERKAALALAADDGVTRAQVVATIQNLLIAVQDRVMTEMKVLRQTEFRSSNWVKDEDTMAEREQDSFTSSGFDPDLGTGLPQPPEIVEQPVWGIDCYTRQNIMICLSIDFDAKTSLVFIEKWLLPAINACPIEFAQDIANAARLLEGLPLLHEQTEEVETQHELTGEISNWSQTLLGAALRRKIESCGPPWLKPAACQLRRARSTLGQDFFRIHPKGHGSVLLSAKVPPNRLVTFYRGELYPSWRWGEKMDAIALTQERKALKPALPDFYNMALERPQADPRGYGLLFVDASRKAGYGSSLSHSCDPTCEVRVTALNGELCLAMTTLRELEMGEELTFDYHAVTESLNEYRSAVCLCGNGKCRGSFLHFATADCYQQVLNRNSPIASRFSNLVKSSMKQVMSDDDKRVLRTHGFHTAAFGAISVNRRVDDLSTGDIAMLDSIDLVPVWLRTYIADTLRYIEYERRALPISLICDQLSSANKAKPLLIQKPLKEPGREPPFFCFSRVERDFLRSKLRNEGFPESACGVELKRALQKVASSCWQEFGEEKKNYWKNRAKSEFEKKKKAWLASKNQMADNVKATKSMKARYNSARPLPGILEVMSSQMKFEDADAEGVSAMEQRIQQLAQTLSRIGRVLDRHREGTLDEVLKSNADAIAISLDELQKIVHPPLSVLSDEDVVGWIWSSSDGVVTALLRHLEGSSFARPQLHLKLKHLKETKYGFLSNFSDPTLCTNDGFTVNGIEGRVELKRALLEMRKVLLEEIKDMGREIRRCKSFQSREGNGRKEGTNLTDRDLIPGLEGATCLGSSTGLDVDDHPNRNTETLKDGFHAVNGHAGGNQLGDNEFAKAPDEASGVACHDAPFSKHDNGVATEPSSSPLSRNVEWMDNYDRRFVLQAAADLLLMYANTSNFFVIKPYAVLQSTPVEVYARELGNSVPRCVIDETLSKTVDVHHESCGRVPSSVRLDQSIDDKEIVDRNHILREVDVSASASDTCSPNDIVATVTVRYQGDYVLSQLLQWYNGGIGQVRGLPDLLGCVLLPKMEGCFSSLLTTRSRRKSERRTIYELSVRKRLIEWFQDPFKRGNPWPEEIREAFEQPGEDLLRFEDASLRFLPLGSPITDFLITGDESNIHNVLGELDADDAVSSTSNAPGLLASVDKGRPAQAVSTWVQCEECLKWRKIPWHVDVDLLPEKFYCVDNVWNPAARSCSAPEDVWDNDDTLVDADGKVDSSPVRKRKTGTVSPLDEKSFRVGARFDVLRSGRNTYCMGIVSKVDFSGKLKRVLFHFPKVHSKYDEWIEFGSERIARLNSKAPREPNSVHDETSRNDGADKKAKKPRFIKPQDSCDVSLLDHTCFRVGGRFDVLRKGKSKYSTGVVSAIDFDGEKKQILFHFPKASKFDEWIEVGSNRIAPHQSKCSSVISTGTKSNVTGKSTALTTEQDTTNKISAIGRIPVSSNVLSNDDAKLSCDVTVLDQSCFRVGGRFDVLRKGKIKYCTGVVSAIDFDGEKKQVLFHFPKASKFDEWIEVGSNRIAPHQSKCSTGTKRNATGKSTALTTEQDTTNKISAIVTIPVSSNVLSNGDVKLSFDVTVLDQSCFRVGGRFDVLRKGKIKYCTGVVSAIDFDGEKKQVLFHFPKTNSKFDEWIEVGSDRIAPHKSKCPLSISAENNRAEIRVENVTTHATQDHLSRNISSSTSIPMLFDSQSNTETQSLHAAVISSDEKNKGETHHPLTARSSESNDSNFDTEFSEVATHTIDEKHVVVGAQFDFCRKSKKKYCIGKILQVEFFGGSKRVLVHFKNVPSKFDEWIEIPSDRISPLFSKVPRSEPKAKRKPAESARDLTLILEVGSQSMSNYADGGVGGAQISSDICFDHRVHQEGAELLLGLSSSSGLGFQSMPSHSIPSTGVPSTVSPQRPHEHERDSQVDLRSSSASVGIQVDRVFGGSAEHQRPTELFHGDSRGVATSPQSTVPDCRGACDGLRQFSPSATLPSDDVPYHQALHIQDVRPYAAYNTYQPQVIINGNYTKPWSGVGCSTLVSQRGGHTSWGSLVGGNASTSGACSMVANEQFYFASFGPNHSQIAALPDTRVPPLSLHPLINSLNVNGQVDRCLAGSETRCIENHCNEQRLGSSTKERSRSD